MTAPIIGNAAGVPIEAQRQVIADVQSAIRKALQAPDADLMVLHRSDTPNILVSGTYSKLHGYAVHTVRFHPERNSVTFHSGYYNDEMMPAVDEYLRRTS